MAQAEKFGKEQRQTINSARQIDYEEHKLQRQCVPPARHRRLRGARRGLRQPWPPLGSLQRATRGPSLRFFAFLQQLLSVGGLSEVGEVGCRQFAARMCPTDGLRPSVPKG